MNYKPFQHQHYSINMISGILAVLVTLLIIPITDDSAYANEYKEDDEDKFRVAVARFSHETCTFCPGEKPDIEDWKRMGDPAEGDEVLRMSSYVRGFTDQTKLFGDTELIGLTSPVGVFGGTSRTWNKEEVFEHFVGRMLEELEEAGPVDGVFLSLHGAMAVENITRPEAEMARRFREVVGPDVPIVATFDLHGNEDKQFLEYADGSFVTKRFPHYDAYHQGERASNYLRRVMKEEYTPTKSVRRVPIITATVLQWTGQSPLMDVYERARRWEDRHKGAYVSVFLGFPWSDVPTVGTSVHVMTDDDQELADEIARDMDEFIWRVREDWAYGEFPQPEEAVRKTRQAIDEGKTPVVLADYWDRPGDATWTLQELIDQEVSDILYSALTDEPALEQIWEDDLSPGDPIDMEFGGYTGEQAGEPVAISGQLAWRGERWGYDKVAVIEFGDNNMLVVTPGYQQNTTPEQLRFGPIEPDDYDVFVLKTRVHFRRGFDETGYAETIHIVDAPGDWFGTIRLDALDYENVDLQNFYPFGEPR